MPDPVLQARAENLYEQLRCVVCQSQTIAGSNSEMAAAMRASVREQLEAGKSDAAVLSYLRGIYGDKILMKPPLKPGTWLLWFMPALALLAGGFLVFRSLKGKA